MHTVIFIYEDRVFIVNANSTQKSHPLHEKKIRIKYYGHQQHMMNKIFREKSSCLSFQCCLRM